MRFLKYLVVSVLLVFSGCTSDKVQVIETNGEKVMTSSPSDFKNETYIWESWIYPSVKK